MLLQRRRHDPGTRGASLALDRAGGHPWRFGDLLGRALSDMGDEMIPTIEQIIEDLAAGSITKQQAISWMHIHAEGAANELRDHFAANAMTEVLAQKDAHDGREWFNVAWIAYQIADAMLAERSKP